VNNLSLQMWNRFKRIRFLRRVMPLFDAIKVAFTEDNEGMAQILLTPIGRNVVIRLGTSDLKCLEKVFIADEYRLPFVLFPHLIVDAGANIGMATLYFANQFPEARIIAIEPEPSNFCMLKRNCGGLPRVTLVQAALWPDHCPLTISSSTAEKWRFTVTDQSPSGSSLTGIPTVTIQDVLSLMGADRIDLLKLDIEGAEVELFREGADRWLDRVRIIAIELHDRFRPGCAQALYSALMPTKFVQEIGGENIFIKIAESK
jgi:FkbM family methyltransferase